MKNRAFDESKYQNWIDPAEVKPYEWNAKLHPPEQIKAIVDSIKRFGWQQDTVITADDVLVIGHGRRLAAIKLGCQMPYHRVGKNADELTDDEIKGLRLADNLTAVSGYDQIKLDLELEELKDFGMEDFGFELTAGEFVAVAPEPVDDYDYDDGFDDYQSPLSPEEIAAYESNANDYLEKRHVIITYPEDKEAVVKKLLRYTGEMKVVIDLEELNANYSNMRN